MNTTEHDGKATITFSIKEEKIIGGAQSIFSLPIRGKLINSKGLYRDILNTRFTFEENGKESTLDFVATKKN